MRRNPVYIFENQLSVGIYDIPVESLILITDTDGNETPMMVQIISKEGLSPGSTIGDFLASNNWKSAGTYIPLNLKGAPEGVAELNADGVIPVNQLPSIALTDTFVAASEAEQLALVVQAGDVCVRSDLNKTYIALTNTNADMDDWQELLTPTDAVQSVNGQTGVVILSTNDIAEGSANLYYTDIRVRNVIAGSTTNNLAEGSINLYYTDARVDANIANKTTDDIAEGSTNLYYTDARADARVQIAVSNARIDTLGDVDTTTVAPTTGQVLKYNGTLWVPGDDIDTQLITSVNSKTGAVLLNTDDIGEGSTNVYYTSARANTDFDTRLATKTTSDIAEGSNLYYTDARADARVQLAVNNATIDTLGDVDTTTVAPNNGQVLKYNGSQWVPGDDDNTDTTYTAGTGLTLTGTEFALSDEVYTSAEKTKLAGIEDNATADMTGAEIKTAYENEADTNAYTDAEKTKLAGIEDGADVNVQADWNEANNTSDAFIANKPTDITNLSSHSISELNDVDTATVAPTTGQTIKWDGTNWIPADDTDTTYTAGTGLSLNGNEFALDTDTDGIAEGSTNLYYTNARVMNVIGASSINTLADVDTTTVAPLDGQILKWDDANGVWIPADDMDTHPVTSVNGYTGAIVLDTDNISEGATNLYFTNARADARIGLASIDDLADVDTTTVAPLSGQRLEWDGNNWVPSTDEIISVISDLNDVNTAGVANGQVLKFNGTNWVPGDDDNTDTTYTAGTGLTLTGTEFALSDEIYTSTEKTKLAGIEDGAEVNDVAAAVANIADTSTATTQDVGDKVNELLNSLRAAGILAT